MEVNGTGTTVPYAEMSTEWDDDYAKELAEAINWQNQVVAKTHGMVLQMWEVFMQLKPLMDSMPVGLMAPPNLSGGPVLPPGFGGKR